MGELAWSRAQLDAAPHLSATKAIRLLKRRGAGPWRQRNVSTRSTGCLNFECQSMVNC